MLLQCWGLNPWPLTWPLAPWTTVLSSLLIDSWLGLVGWGRSWGRYKLINNSPINQLSLSLSLFKVHFAFPFMFPTQQSTYLFLSGLLSILCPCFSCYFSCWHFLCLQCHLKFISGKLHNAINSGQARPGILATPCHMPAWSADFCPWIKFEIAYSIPTRDFCDPNTQFISLGGIKWI